MSASFFERAQRVRERERLWKKNEGKSTESIVLRDCTAWWHLVTVWLGSLYAVCSRNWTYTLIHGRHSISSCTNSIPHAQQAGRSLAESSISISTVQPSCVVFGVLDGCCRSSTCGDASLGPLSHRASFDSIVTDDGVLRVCVLRVSCAYHTFYCRRTRNTRTGCVFRADARVWNFPAHNFAFRRDLFCLSVCALVEFVCVCVCLLAGVKWVFVLV